MLGRWTDCTKRTQGASFKTGKRNDEKPKKGKMKSRDTEQYVFEKKLSSTKLWQGGKTNEFDKT